VPERVPDAGGFGETAGYSRAVRVGPHVAVSGTAPLSEGQLLHPDDSYRQTQAAIARALAAAAELGARDEDVVRTRLLLAPGCDWEQALLGEGLEHGWDGDFAFVVFSHDEYQVACRNDPAVIEAVRHAAVLTGRNAGLPYNFKCPLDVDTKVGANWAETH
jgi:hypothetical protein